MKKGIKKVFNVAKEKVERELTLEEANAYFFGTTKPKPGQKIIQWDKPPDIQEIIRKERMNSMNIDNTLDENKNMIDLNEYSHNKKLDITASQDIDQSDLTQVPELSESKPIMMNKPRSKVPVHPRDVPYMKLEKIYEYDTIQLVESLKYIEYNKANLNKFINFLAVLRKKKEMKIYDFPEILKAIEFIRENLKIIQPSYQISFFYSLSKLQKFDDKKPSLDDQNLIFEVLTHITSKINKIDIRGMSNMAYALHTLQLNNPQVYNFDEFFTKLEEQIILKIQKHIKELSSQDISNIILAYCKTQNGSEEFYRILQEIVIEMKLLLKSQDIAVILYSYANNPTCNEKVLESFEEIVRKNIMLYKSKEICSILRAYHMRKLLSDDLKSLFIEAFIEKHELTNGTDLAYFYNILAETNDSRFLKYAHKCISNLFFTFSPGDLAVILDKAGFIMEKDPEVYKLLQKQVLKLLKKGDFKGFDLKKIYISIKDLPFEGKYNLFIEELERKLEKMKYF